MPENIMGARGATPIAQWRSNAASTEAVNPLAPGEDVHLGGVISAVKFVRWPAQNDLRNQCKKEGIPRLLIVEGGAQPPICNDPFEDWVRAPISKSDLEARVRALQNRLDRQQTPRLDSTGTLCYGPRSVTISNTQTGLMELLIEHFGEVVYRDELAQRLAERVPRPTRNSLDLHIMRLRRRLSMTGLVIRTVWGRGYVLETEATTTFQDG